VLLLRRTFLGKIVKNSKAVADHLMLDYDHETTREVDWILGACMLVRREAVQSVGQMDERFFLYFEDVDWCYRMKQKNWKVYYCPKSVVTHDYARDSAQSVINRSFVAHLASLIRYYEKWNRVLYFVKRYREVLKLLLFLVADLVAFNAAFLSAYYLRIALGDVFTNPLFPIFNYKKFVYFENLLFVFSYFALGLYKVRRDTTSVDELFSIVRAIFLASVLLMASTYLGQIRTYSRMVVAFLVPFAVLYDWALRSGVRKLHRLLLAQKIDLKSVCIVGPWEQAKALERNLQDDASLGVDVVGIVGTDPTIDSAGKSLGSPEELDALVDRYRIQEIVLLPGAVPDDRIAELVTMGRRRALDITVITDYSGMVIHQASVTSRAGRPAISYRRDTRYTIDRVVKRLMDIVLGLLFLVVSLPISVVYLLYASIRDGAAFSREERLGLGGKPFMLPVAGTRSSAGPSDIVSSPLFWLVVTGKMSMVGPYPFPSGTGVLLDDAAGFRFDARPGITGFWRMGSGDEVHLDDLLAQDASYIRNWSLGQDLKILMMSLRNIILGRKRILIIRAPSKG
jgi:lipopolysaccharide/colanic/teichoic acid biosynthesis glycosyltransferase